MTSPYLPPLVIGGGNMARAIVQGAAARGLGVFSGGILAEPDPAKHGSFLPHGLRTFESVSAARPHAAAAMGTDRARTLPILLAVKPQMLADVARDLAGAFAAQRVVVISILAGTTIARLESAMGGARRIVRSMPNLPASIGQGATALSPSAGASAADATYARAIFEAVGPVVVDLPEPLMDAFTALAGSGPAYVFYLAEAMARAGEAMGFDAETSLTLVRQTIIGAAGLLVSSTQTPGELRAAVTSKGGTTAAATAALDNADVAGLWIEAIKAAQQRGRELSGS